MGSELLGFGVSISALSSSMQSAQEGGLTFGWHRAEVVGGVLEQECGALIRSFFEAHRG